jgi:hypothetical protein
MQHYILDLGGSPVPAHDIQTWAVWFQTANLSAGYDVIGDSVIRTDFQGFALESAIQPHLWLTKVIGGPLDQVQDRCPGTREDAAAMHASICQRVRALTE